MELMPEHIPIPVNMDWQPITYVRVRPSLGENCTHDIPIRQGRLIINTWKDPPPRKRWDQKPGGHSRKVDSFSGHAGHHGGIGDLRFHQRDDIDWDAALETDLDEDVDDAESRFGNTWTYSDDDWIRIPNCCGAKYAVVLVVIQNGRRYVFLRRDSLNNWCMYRREWPVFPPVAYATVTGDWAGTITLTHNGAFMQGSAVVDCTSPSLTLYLQHGCIIGTGGLAGCTENPVGLRGSMNGTVYAPASSALFGTTCTCIPWYFATFDLSLSAVGGVPGCSVFHVVISE